MAERSNAAVSKTVSGFWVRRGFKSLPLRFASHARFARVAQLALTGETMFPPWAPFFAMYAGRFYRARERGLGRGYGRYARELTAPA